jgi:hypothetical protein
MCTAFPHPSVGANGVVCCEMLGNLPWSDSKAQAGLGWSPSYSPYSIMLLLLALQEGGFPVGLQLVPSRA